SKILTFGSLNIDYVYSVDHFVQKGETLASSALEIFSGGKGLNQSVALGRAGAEVFHAGAVGPDGQFLLDLLQEAGVDTHLVSSWNPCAQGMPLSSATLRETTVFFSMEGPIRP